jgi:hypothetical protein
MILTYREKQAVQELLAEVERKLMLVHTSLAFSRNSPAAVITHDKRSVQAAILRGLLRSQTLIALNVEAE